jgi:hypothetical protein
MNTMDSNTMPAMAQNKIRQPTKGNSHCTGKVEDNMPNEPVISIHELARICVGASNQRRYAVNGAIRQQDTPTPVRMRAKNKPVKLSAQAKATQPKTAATKNDKITLFGPWRSSQLPMGNCISEKPKK